MKDILVEKIKKAAKQDKIKRKDPRFLRTMAFLTKKGALKANRDYDRWYRGKLFLRDALWTGEHVEPRVLEVLPAMALRLPKEVIYTKAPDAFLMALEALRNDKNEGPDFMGISFAKYKVWLDLELKDKRTKPARKKKIMRSFRLSPHCIKKLEQEINKTGKSGSEVIESLLK